MRHIHLYIEFILLCVILPSCIIAFRLAPFMFFFLWFTAAYCWLTVLRKKNFWSDVWKWDAVNRENLKIIIPRWILACIGMTIFIVLVDPDRVLSLAINKPLFLPILFVLYPILSALPQEIIFCSFFFDRYKPLFGEKLPIIIASTLVFAYAHVLFINWIAPFLSLIAGYIFSSTYARTKSLALVTLEHSLYGNFLFFIGLGWYFYGGAIHQ